MLITPGEILRFPRYPIGDFWRGIASCKTSREVTSRGVGMCKVTSDVAWRPVSQSHVCLKNWMLGQPDQKK